MILHQTHHLLCMKIFGSGPEFQHFDFLYSMQLIKQNKNNGYVFCGLLTPPRSCGKQICFQLILKLHVKIYGFRSCRLQWQFLVVFLLANANWKWIGTTELLKALFKNLRGQKLHNYYNRRWYVTKTDIDLSWHNPGWTTVLIMRWCEKKRQMQIDYVSMFLSVHVGCIIHCDFPICCVS